MTEPHGDLGGQLEGLDPLSHHVFSKKIKKLKNYYNFLKIKILYFSFAPPPKFFYFSILPPQIINASSGP
jgi:hypothetical protein